MALFCVISANSGSFRAHSVKVHVRYLISWWVIVCYTWMTCQPGSKTISRCPQTTPRYGQKYRQIQIVTYYKKTWTIYRTIVSEVATEATSREVQSYACWTQLSDKIYGWRLPKFKNFATDRGRKRHTTSDLKSSTQCNKAANKAMSVLRMVNRAFRGMDKKHFLVVYKSFIRPHLEYCVES